MYIQSCCKKNEYEISSRDYLDDYSHVISKKIDMTLSGRYLYKYPFKLSNVFNIDRYPTHYEISKLKTAIQSKYNIDIKEKSIILGAGSNGIIQNMVKLFFSNNFGNLVTSYLTFNQAEYSVSSFGSLTKRVYMDDYKINFDNFDKAIDTDTKLVYFCNPNNPTGILIENEDIIKFANRHRNVHIILDESNIEFSNMESILYKNTPTNLIILKSFSKVYGLSNLRIGYAICSKEIEQEYLKNITVNEFSGLSCELALKSINSNYYLKNSKIINREKNYLCNKLELMGIDVISSNSNTIMTKTVFDLKFINRLEKNDVSVIPIVDENNKIHIRIAVQDRITNRKFLKIMKKVYLESKK